MLTQRSQPTYYARLQFADAAACVAWMESVPLADVAVAHEMLAAQTELLGRTDLPPIEKLRILEVMHRPIAFVQAGLARRYTDKALPLSIAEYALWNSAIELWQTVFAVYHQCLDAHAAGDGSLAAHGPLIALRCLEAAGASMLEHHRAYREVPSGLWRQLHHVYARAERAGFAATAIEDRARDSSGTRTCMAAYARALLARLANPYTMSARQHELLCRWLEAWAALPRVVEHPPVQGMTALLAVDMDADAGVAPASSVAAAPGVRFLDLEALGNALRRTLTLLRQGHAPASLGLGADCRQPGCERLVTLLYIQWCGAGTGDLVGRRDPTETARACVGMRSACQRIAAGPIAADAEASLPKLGVQGPAVETWRVFGVGTAGFLGLTRGPECDVRVQHHQLVAIRRASARSFQLGVVQWLRLESDGTLSIGLRVLPGAPQTVEIRRTDAQDGATGTHRALILPEVQELQMHSSVVLEPGTFQPGQTVELLGRTARIVQLNRLAEQGADFDRIEFAPAGSSRAAAPA